MTASIEVVGCTVTLKDIPEVGEIRHVEAGDHICFYGINYDECYRLDDEHEFFGYFYSFNTRHVNYCDPEDLPEKNAEYRVSLDYHEHGLSAWAPSASSGLPDCRFDTVNGAGFWYPHEDLIAEYVKEFDGDKGKINDKLLELAKEMCEMYSDWCNGHVYEVFAYAYEKKYAGTRSELSEGDLYKYLVTNSDEYDDELFYERIGGFFASSCAGIRESLEEIINRGFSVVL